jgi:RNA polymerase sigma-70 factor (ECF subfamily)
MFGQAGADRWGLPRNVFNDAVQASVARAFGDRAPSARELDRYLASLHAADLALACACALGLEDAWDHFVREVRPILYRTADAIDPAGGARELADSLYADLYGIKEGSARQSLFRYFHGRSSLATWLRAVLAQRHVDLLRARRRTAPLPDQDDAVPAASALQPDPDRARLGALVQAAMRAAIDRLAAKDRMRLRSYYAVGMTLAQIGRITGEHEATVSRGLTRTRRELREAVEHHLREESRLGADEVARAFELAVDDPGTMDLQELFGAERKESAVDRSR